MKPFWSVDASEGDVVALAGLLDGVDVLVGGEGDLAAEDRLVERERLAGLTAEVDVGGGADAHGASFRCGMAGRRVPRRLERQAFEGFVRNPGIGDAVPGVRSSMLWLGDRRPRGR